MSDDVEPAAVLVEKGQEPRADWYVVTCVQCGATFSTDPERNDEALRELRRLGHGRPHG